MGIIRRKSGMIIFDNAGNISHISKSGDPLFSISDMQKIRDYAVAYLLEMGTDENINRINKELSEQALAESEQEYIDFQKRNAEIAVLRRKNIGKGKCTIYLVRDNIRGCYKIGMTNNIKGRIKTLKISNAGIELHSTYSGIEKDETDLHEIFKEKRISSEWFSLDHKDIEFINTYFLRHN